MMSVQVRRHPIYAQPIVPRIVEAFEYEENCSIYVRQHQFGFDFLCNAPE